MNLVLISVSVWKSGLEIGKDKSDNQVERNILELQKYYTSLGPQNGIIFWKGLEEGRDS